MAALADDLAIAKALAVLFDFVREVNRLIDQGDLSIKARERALHELEVTDSVLDVLRPDIEKEDEQFIKYVENLLEERNRARGLRDYSRADKIRDDLLSKGIIIEDTPQNPFEKKYSLQCINGRVGRMLAAFTLLDADEILSEPEMDANELANVAYSLSADILNNAYENYKPKNPSNISKNKTIKDLHNTLESKLSKEELAELKEFELHVKEEINKRVTEKLKDLVPTSKLVEIIETAQSGI